MHESEFLVKALHNCARESVADQFESIVKRLDLLEAGIKAGEALLREHVERRNGIIYLDEENE